MDDALSLETIREAAAGSEHSAEQVLNAMEGRIKGIAHTEARRMASGDVAAWADEFTQVGRIAVWDCLSRFNGDTVDAFFAFAYRTAVTAVAESARSERNPGADPDAVKCFAYWMKQTDGDAFLAEKLAQRVSDPCGRKLGRDRANAARLSWQTTLSMDVTFSGEQTSEFAGGSGYSVSGGSNNYPFAELLAGSLGIPEDMVTSDDISEAKRSTTIEMVRAVLDVMGEQTANVLRGTFGIDPLSYFGVENNEELAALLGTTPKAVNEGRSKGYKQFAKRWVPLMCGVDANAAQGWWDAFDAERQRANASRTARAAKALAA